MGRTTSSPAPRPTFIVVAAILVLLVCLGLAEVAVRVAAAASPDLRARLRPYDPLAMLVEPVGDVGHRPRPHGVFRYRNGTQASINALGFRGPGHAATKLAGARRVVLLGGSTTFGWGVNDDGTIDAHLRAILDTLTPARPTEVINAALDGYHMYQLLERLRAEVLALEPDVIVVNEGINDVAFAPLEDIGDGDPRTLGWAIPLQRARDEKARGKPFFWSRVKHASQVVQLAGFLKAQLRRRGAATRPRTPRPVRYDAADYFQRSAREIARIATQRGIAVVFSTPPSSLRLNFEPGATSPISYWLADAEQTAAYRDTLAARLEAVAVEFAPLGRVTYVRPTVQREEFLDDTHLTVEGNRLVAAQFAAAITRLLEDR